jgi:hypothetical protein
MTKKDYTYGYTSVSFDYQTEGGGQVNIMDDPHNCKLTHLIYCGGLDNYGNKSEEQMKKKIDAILEMSRIVVSMNTTSKRLAEFLKKNYELYSYTEVPVGYHGGYQYYIVVRNTLTKARNTQYMRPLETAKVPGIDTETVKTVMTNLLKKKRRKTDIVDDLIKVLA